MLLLLYVCRMFSICGANVVHVLNIHVYKFVNNILCNAFVVYEVCTFVCKNCVYLCV